MNIPTDRGDSRNPMSVTAARVEYPSTIAPVVYVESNERMSRRTSPVVVARVSAASEGRSRNARPELWIYGHEFAGSIDAGLDVVALDPASAAVVVARLEIGAIGAAVAVAVAAGCGALT